MQEINNSIDAVKILIFQSGRAQQLNNKMVELLIDRQKDDIWYRRIFYNLHCSLREEYSGLKTAACSKNYQLPATAWRARNLLEISVLITHCAQSEINAKDFFTELGNDGLDILSKLRNWGNNSGLDAEWFGFIDTSWDKLTKSALNSGIDPLKPKHSRILNLAKNFDNKNDLEISYKILSKFAHPTAFSIFISENKEQQKEIIEYFYELGCGFFGLAFEKLDSHIKYFLKNNSTQQPHSTS